MAAANLFENFKCKGEINLISMGDAYVSVTFRTHPNIMYFSYIMPSLKC